MPTYRVNLPPHIRAEDSVPRRLWLTAAALLPTLAVSILGFKWDAVRIVFVSILTAGAAEFLSARLFEKKTALYNGSTILTALLFAMLMPPTVPFWIVLLGSFVAVFFGKEIFGGLGTNPFHPALVGVCFLQVSFPEWMNPVSIQGFAASPLSLLWGSYGQAIGETSVAALLAGGLMLIWKRLVDWRVPFVYLGTLFLFSQTLGFDLWLTLLSGRAFLAAFFLITDPVTTPVTEKGCWLFALGAALGTVGLQRVSSFSNAVPFAVLLMNALTPWIDEWVRPRRARAGVQEK